MRKPYRPVLVYPHTGVKASMIWLPLALLGYDARVYFWVGTNRKGRDRTFPHALEIEVI